MTAKENSLKLINKFMSVGHDGMEWHEAKQCAIISVDEEIEMLLWLHVLCTFDNYMKPHINDKIQELKTVKEEIELL